MEFNQFGMNSTNLERLPIWLNSLATEEKLNQTFNTITRKLFGLLYMYDPFYFYSSQDTLKQLYPSSIRPHLEYAALVCDPHLKLHVNTLESLQKFALKLSTKMCNASYETLL